MSFKGSAVEYFLGHNLKPSTAHFHHTLLSSARGGMAVDMEWCSSPLSFLASSSLRASSLQLWLASHLTIYHLNTNQSSSHSVAVLPKSAFVTWLATLVNRLRVRTSSYLKDYPLNSLDHMNRPSTEHQRIPIHRYSVIQFTS